MIIEPDVQLAELSAGGVMEPRADWTQAAQGVHPSPSLADARALAARGLEQLPEPLRRLEPGATLTVQIGEPLVKLTAEVDRRLGLGREA